jgi:hypothetical protein
VVDAAAAMAAAVAAMAAVVAAMAAAVEATAAAGAAVDVATAAVASGAADRPRVCAQSSGFLQAGRLVPPVNSRIFTDLRAGSLLAGSATPPFR